MLAAPPLPVVTLIAITMAVNTATAAEITLCCLISRAVRRAAPGTLSMLITRHSPFSFRSAEAAAKWLSVGQGHFQAGLWRSAVNAIKA
jgi:hypothetical protein